MHARTQASADLHVITDGGMMYGINQWRRIDGTGVTDDGLASSARAVGPGDTLAIWAGTQAGQAEWGRSFRRLDRLYRYRMGPEGRWQLGHPITKPGCNWPGGRSLDGSSSQDEIHHPRSPGEATGVPCSRRGAPARKRTHRRHGWHGRSNNRRPMPIIPFEADNHTATTTHEVLSVSRLTATWLIHHVGISDRRPASQPTSAEAQTAGHDTNSSREPPHNPNIHPSAPSQPSGDVHGGRQTGGWGSFFSAGPRHRSCIPSLALSLGARSTIRPIRPIRRARRDCSSQTPPPPARPRRS